ncbi:zinc finger protein 628-like [Amphibalanus amphitrite]|uniref:zinc finger protein 628-like n=1 Tax=Amphibalanus amphitrite TaxID=1232801 RepID=UPI001C913A8C|nr:zinc finger protein 628-like [Amphibalanus amphitrite]
MMEDLGTYLSQAGPNGCMASYQEPLPPHAGPDSRCILCDSYITCADEPPTGVDINGFRLPSTQETLAEKLDTVVHPGCGVSLHTAAHHWQMKYICMACSAVIMTLDSYETKILEIREEIKRKFLDMMKIRAEKFGALQPLPPPLPSPAERVSSVKREPREEAGAAAAVVAAPAGAPEETSEERLECEVDLHCADPLPAAPNGVSPPGSETELTCGACNKSFRNKYNLKRHSTVHAGVKPFSCEFCGRAFRLKDHLKTHTRCGPAAAPLQCAPCGLTFPCFTLYSEHRQQYHSEGGDNPCRHCELVFTTATELRRHCRQQHPHPVKQEFRCSVCGRDFPNGFNLRRHLLIHSGERPFGCDLCGKRFTQPSILKKHTRVHDKKPPELKELLTSM